MAKRNLRGYRVTMVNLYHDSMPQSPTPSCGRTPGHTPSSTMPPSGDRRGLAVRKPRGSLRQLQAYQEVGCTQMRSAPDEGFAHEQVLEMIEVFGQQVIPEFDTDPEHSTTRYRRQAQRRFPTFNNPVDPIVDQATPTRVRDLDLTLSPASRTRRRAPERRRGAPRASGSAGSTS